MNLEANIKEIKKYITSTITPSDAYKIFPCHFLAFVTNPVSLSYGAGGILYFLNKIGHKKHIKKIVNWILNYVKDNKLPPGLYIGSSGIALTLLKAGFKCDAEKIINIANSSPLKNSHHDLFYGEAGIGVANLYFYYETQNQFFLEESKKSADYLISTAEKSTDGIYWKGRNDTLFYGLAHGASGVAHFLLNLFKATNENRYLDYGVMALNFDLAAGKKMGNMGFGWPMSKESEVSKVLCPYWEYGSAGIGMVAIRYYDLLKNDKYLFYAKKCAEAADVDFSLFPGSFRGLCGLGNFLIDMYQYTGDDNYLKSAHRIAGNITLFRIKKKTGSAYPGEMLLRISCDYGTGSAGIGLFFHRLLTNGHNDFHDII